MYNVRKLTSALGKHNDKVGLVQYELCLVTNRKIEYIDKIIFYFDFRKQILWNVTTMFERYVM